MPEGVELKLSAELVKPLVINKPIISLGVTNNSRYSQSMPEGMQNFIDDIKKSSKPTTVTNVEVHGKFMYWTFSNGWYMFCTFGMTGQWSPKRGKHPCFFMTFNHNDQIYFNDPRHFGTIKFTNKASDLTNKLNELGWDPLSMDLDKNFAWIVSQLSKLMKPIAEVLMNQKIFAGVGNYIRAEALYLSKLDPWHQANLLSKDQIRLLCQSIIDVMNESYKYQGATISTYKSVYGEEGKYSSLFKVYGQKQDPLGNPVYTAETADKRTIHWCPNIQK